MNHCHETSSSDIQELSALVTCKLITRPLDELHPHPSYARHCVTVPISKLSALAERSDLAFQEPIRITRDGIIIDGYARVELARQLGRTELLCLEYDLSETESLQEMLEAHQSSRGFNAFQRTVLALDLESEFQEQARSHQREGGRNKGSSKLTEAERLDVRSRIAAVAGVSAGNVRKVKWLTTAAHHDLTAALKTGEISIHLAWTWSQKPLHEQLDALWWQRTKKGLNKTTQELVSRHRPKSSLSVPDPGELANRLAALRPNQISSIKVSVVKGQGKAIYLTEELALALDFQQMDLCEATSR